MANIQELLDLMAALRDPEHGCPWDRAQAFASIAPYTVEEAYEVADAIARENMDDLRDELGDLLFQVVFHARMAAERGDFDFHDVVAGIVAKMVRRHPHVFADECVDSVVAQSAAWETHKARERAARCDRSSVAPGVLDGVARGLPALMRARKLQARASRVGFDWSAAPAVLPKLEEEIAELADAIAHARDLARVREELGDVLFTVVNLARHLEVDAEAALSAANAKFERRFRQMESLARAADCNLVDCGPDALEELWRRAKEAENG